MSRYQWSTPRHESATRFRASIEMVARCVMVLGTTSGAGKSWLATALCRHFARQGLKVAPFKAQNMSNNARVVAGMGDSAVGEIGSAQYFQALAACAVPTVGMNPVLLKPERDTHSQVVLMGRVNDNLTHMPWRSRSEQVWPVITQALDALVATHDVVVIEGAGSPAEINLYDSDIVNMRVALHVQAQCLLVTDIDRGGAFAHLFGTWSLLPEPERALIKGFVLNKFRGDASLLAPGPEMLQALTGVPTVATLPMWRDHGLPEEDWMVSVAPARPHFESALPALNAVITIAIIAYPRISNIDEFQPLAHLPGVRLCWVRRAADMPELAATDQIILPGSKHTSGDLAWLREQGLAQWVAAHAARGGAVLGICGGLQMLGEALIDPHGIDGNAPGLGLLPLVTIFRPNKTLRVTQASFDTASLGPVAGAPSPWAALGGVPIRGYEIRHGHTRQQAGNLSAELAARVAMPGGLAWCNSQGNVLGIYLHGLFENPQVLRALFRVATPEIEQVFEQMADFVERHFAPGVLDALVASHT